MNQQITVCIAFLESFLTFMEKRGLYISYLHLSLPISQRRNFTSFCAPKIRCLTTRSDAFAPFLILSDFVFHAPPL